MIYLVYYSSANRLMSGADLVDLLRVSSRNNQRLGVTGMLLYHDGAFMQVLEGEATAVQAIYAAIVRDPRHRHIIKLTETPLERRNFSHWAMAFRDTQDLTEDDLAAYSLFLSQPVDERQYQGHQALRLLLDFRETVR